MKEHEMRFRVTHSLYKRYKIVCTELDLSIPEQMEQMMMAFVDVQEHNIRVMKKLKE